jgi:orotate phosphoribosyltransferase
MTTNLQDLGRRLKEAAYTEGDFTLRSGRKSRYIIDKYAFETRPDLLREIARELTRLLPPGTRRLAGVELGAVPLVTAVALESGLPFVIVRKNSKGHGLDRPFEGPLAPGEKMVLVEDVCTTGGAALAAVQVLREAGIADVTVLGVVDRQEGAAEAFRAAGVPFRSLFTRESLGIRPGGERA